jgi:hypothetical protein
MEFSARSWVFNEVVPGAQREVGLGSDAGATQENRSTGGKMKTMKLALSLILTLGLAACSSMQPISRDQLAQNIDPILKMEKRLDQVMYYTKMLGSMGGLTQVKSKELKQHLDVYYVYYLASNVQLAKGDMDAFQAHVALAERELDVMEKILKDGLDKDFEPDPNANWEGEFSRSKL